MKTLLKVENLNYREILKNINFDLNSGTITALMGNCGSGKTTLLKSLFGLIKAEGFVCINGIILTKDNKKDLTKEMAICLSTQNLENLSEEKTVYQNIIESLSNLGFADKYISKQSYEFSKKLGIETLLYKKVNELSYSQKKLVLLLQTTIHNPKIILLDDIFESMDLESKNKTINYLQWFKSKKNSILFTTNNSEDLIWSDNLIIMKKGEIKSQGSCAELFENDNIFIKNKLRLPFLVELSHKLKLYGLIDKLVLNYDEMVDEIWQ